MSNDPLPRPTVAAAATLRYSPREVRELAIARAGVLGEALRSSHLITSVTPTRFDEFRRLVRLTDAGIIIVFSAALVAVHAVSASTTFGDAGTITFLVLVPLAWLTTVAVARTREVDVLGSGRHEYRSTMFANLIAFGIVGLAFVALDPQLSRAGLLATLAAGGAALLTARWGWRGWLDRHADESHSRTIVAGTAQEIECVLTRLRSRLGSSHTVVGVVLTEKPMSAVPALPDRCVVYHEADSIRRAACELSADLVILGESARRSPETLRTLAWELEGTATQIAVATELFDLCDERVHLQQLDGLALLRVDLPTFSGPAYVVKRSFDIVVSTVALVLLAPLLAAIAIAIRLDSPGGALFRQVRCGRDGAPFTMWKFRTMVVDAESELTRLMDQNEGAGVLFKLRTDPRVTRVGALLRKLSLDELPQLWNILRGDMSIVGPRPPLPREVDAYEQPVHRRLNIKPGLTGLWQVSGRSDLSWEESVRLDLYYVENWSLWGDVKIIARTAATVVQGRGAY